MERTKMTTFLQKGLTAAVDCVKINFASERCGSSSVVECHLAKVDVASPNLVYRSTVAPWPSGKAKLCKSFILQFDSGWRLHQGTQILIQYLGLFFCIFLELRCKVQGIISYNSCLTGNNCRISFL